MSNILTVTDASFASDVINNEKPVLVDFWAEWCGPCKALAPTLEEVANELAGKVVIAKLNVDDNEEIPVQFGIRSIPTMILFKNGQNVGSKIGAASKKDLIDFIESTL